MPLQHLQGGVATDAAFQRREVEQHTRALYYYYLALLLTYLWRAVKLRRPHPLPLPQCTECLRHVRLRVRLRLGHRVRVGLRVGLGLVSGSGEGSGQGQGRAKGRARIRIRAGLGLRPG